LGWRVGTKLGRTLYNEHGDLVGMMDTPELAARVVEAVNAFDQAQAEKDSGPRCGHRLGTHACTMPANHGGDWHDDGKACWPTWEPEK
jgi:hypothetical protein